MSELEAMMALQFRAYKMPVTEEYKFAEAHVGAGKGIRNRLKEAGLKNWRFDFAFLDQKIAVEIEGGAWTGGRHTRGKGFSEDLIKYDAAMNLGWTVYRCDGSMVKNGCAINTIRKLLEICNA
jgi:very-short-patch-repair endonuclease